LLSLQRLSPNPSANHLHGYESLAEGFGGSRCLEKVHVVVTLTNLQDFVNFFFVL
jgi:hypothetical protein